MKIAIDISPIVYGTGVSVYTKELVRNLLKIDKDNEYILFGGSLRRRDEIRDFVSTLKGNFKARILPIAPTLADTLWNKFHILSVDSFVGKVDVFHSSDWTQPPSSAFKVTTIHDLVPILYPEWSDPKIVAVHKRRIEKVKSEVDAIIVPSHQTKKDLMKLGFPTSKIFVIEEAVDSTFTKATKKEIEEVKIKYETGDKYLLSIGITARKNTQTVIHAYNLLKKEKKYSDYKLVLVGHPYIGLNSAEGVVITDYVDQKDFVALHSGASVFVYPSLYEGFGLPILEAMKVGVPVVTSKNGSMKEVAGEAAVLVESDSEKSIKEGIIKADSERKRYIQKGLERIKGFSWDNNARETLEIYNKALDK